MQSGISASQELVSQFNTLLGSDSYFGLLATIESETLKPLDLLSPVAPGASFADNLSVLAPYLKPNEALYLILRRHDTIPRFVAISYVPDAAKVRQKMLFASTRLTLTRELGSEHFRETLFVTDADELTARGFEKHDAHVKLDAPLTEEEQTLGAVKRAEQEAGSGTGVKEIHLSSHMKLPVDQAATSALKELGEGSGRVLASLTINTDTEVVELAPTTESPTSISELIQSIPTSEPRFTFFRYTHTHNGQESSPVLFFYTYPAVPGKGAIRNRMLYPLMKRAVLTIAEGEAGLTIAAKFDSEDPSEITEASVVDELHPKVETRQAFSRPKRPGRR
ncbi:twinfilin-2 [Plectosphaerella plurivora]|uniref:Twinfilin n=1 Tax=Plectosphaerella plurivora TaxID=936078 RepID=A0A9P8VKC1_9PEZI|nr:twinfilin-2 [Plectosphaerella plurivora]